MAETHEQRAREIVGVAVGVTGYVHNAGCLTNAIAAALADAERETALKCADMAMQKCREFNERATGLRREGRHLLAEDRERIANIYALFSDDIRRAFGLEEER